MAKLNVKITELTSGYVVTFQSLEPGSSGREYACTTLTEALDVILEHNDELKEKVNGTV